MSNDAKLLDAFGPGALTLRVEFMWRGDRFCHLVSVVEANGAILPLLESIEGTPAQAWPPSPPLQNLSLESLPDGRRALLMVGMAGRSHWSASIEPVEGEAALRFELACRHVEPPASLGSRYLERSEASNGFSIRVTEARMRRESLPDGDQISIQPTSFKASAGTTQWSYVIASICEDSARPTPDSRFPTPDYRR